MTNIDDISLVNQNKTEDKLIPSVQTKNEIELKLISARINMLYSKHIDIAKQAITNAIELGGELEKAKLKCDGSQNKFEFWLNQECPRLRLSRAYDLIRLSHETELLDWGANSTEQIFPTHLTALLNAPTEVRETVKKRIGAGKKISVSEIHALKKASQKKDFTKSKPLPSEEIIEVNPMLPQESTEHQLYPLLVEYLKNKLKLYCLRIDEKRSKNQRGNGGNQWLHPDIVAMQPVDKEWHELVRSCVQRGGGQTVRLWSFEVKKELNSSNVRMSFFQAVSNSSWANEGYLVAVSITDNVKQELRMLSALHGIGVILLKPQNPCESEILLPAIARIEIDWQSVNRIVIENEDFRSFVELVSTYYQTGRIIGDWNKVYFGSPVG